VADRIEPARTVTEAVPAEVVRAATGHRLATLLSCHAEPIGRGMGSATETVARLVGWAECGGSEARFSVVRKRFSPRSIGRHNAGVHDPRHWAYWRRELLAYASGLLPTAGGLVAPACLGAVGDTVWLQDVGEARESARVAARRLGAWQATSPIPDVPWLAGHQLAQRVAVSALDFRGVDVDRRLVDVWARREELLARLVGVPEVVGHGDFSLDNLVAAGDRTVVLDWATLGVSPVGADLAHLALSSLEDVVEDYLAGLGGRFDEAAVRLGYRVTAGLTGASRMHWMRANGVPVPGGYQEFVLGLLG
jgi:hypothetical protein